MRFYTTTHQYYCGIDLRARVMYLCIISSDGEIVLHRNMKADPESLLKAIKPYRPNVDVGVEYIFTWYWVADICAEEEIPFTLGHALYMKAIHGGNAKNHDPQSLYLLRTIYGIGKILSLTILYEIGDIDRFPRVQNFASYSRLVKCARESAGKRYGTSESKIENVHLKWAFYEASVMFLRGNPEGMKYKKQLERKHGKAKSLSILAHKLGRATYYMLKRQKAFDMKKFLRA